MPQPGGSLQLAAFQIQVAAADDVALLRDWLASGDALPDGVVVDLDLRWRILLRLAKLGGVDRDQLAAALAEEPTAVSQVEHAKALASLPDAEAKAWAWQRFTGEVEVPNYELEAIGLGLWQVGQERLTDPYVARYFDEVLATTEVRSGQMLARGDQRLLPALVGHRGDGRPGARPARRATTSTPRSAASWSTRPGTSSVASRSDRRSADDRASPTDARPRRPGPTVRTRVTELGDGTRAHAARTGWPPRSPSRSGWPGPAPPPSGSG